MMTAAHDFPRRLTVTRGFEMMIMMLERSIISAVTAMFDSISPLLDQTIADSDDKDEVLTSFRTLRKRYDA